MKSRRGNAPVAVLAFLLLFAPIGYFLVRHIKFEMARNAESDTGSSNEEEDEGEDQEEGERGFDFFEEWKS